jgi:tRNA(Arg) A34 adenosine deaminase TadA
MRRRIVQFERDHLDDKLFREAVDLHGSRSQGETSARDYIVSNGLCKGLGERVCRNPEEYFTVWRPVSTVRRFCDTLLMQEMRTDGTWGESLEIMTAAVAFGVNITVHVGERRGTHAELLQRETVHHFPCGTVDERRAAGLPDRVYGRIYLHSSDGSSQYQWKRPNVVNMFLGLLDDRNYERFQRALTAAASKQAVSNYIIDKKMIPFLSKSQMLKKESKEAWKAIKAECYLEFQKKDSIKIAHPLASFIFWLTSHCCISHKCKGMEYISDFIDQKKTQSDMNLECFLRILYEFRFLHFPEKDFSKQKYQTQCLFDGEQHNYLFSLCECELPTGHNVTMKRNALYDFVQNTIKSSDLTARWLRRETGRSYKLWGRMSRREYDRCEVKKCSSDSKGDKWRHMIYAYALMSLLWSEYNGNKEGPLGDYPDRRGSEIGRMIDRKMCKRLLQQLEEDDQSVPSDLVKILGSAEFVFPSKAGGGPADYNGHNIVALAVGKRGEILRISFNHNTLFSSTVDHAEERLIDGLYRDPEAFVQRSHARIYDSKLAQNEKMEVEKHMRHISVYTSLEPCQQCSGKFHLALVPEVIFCQRDWEIELLQEKLYERHHKCRPVPASFFGFTPYEELAIAYNYFCQKINSSKAGITFFSQQAFSSSATGPRVVPAKQTMPYFLCSNEAQIIFRRGSVIFNKLLRVLFKGPESASLADDEFFDWSSIKSDAYLQNSKKLHDDFMECFNLDVSDWILNRKGSDISDSQCSSQYEDSVGYSEDSYATITRTASSSPIAKTVVKNSDACRDIRDFRPSLNAKQNRLSQDELISLRGVWIDNMFKQRRTLMFEFDRYSGISEKDIDTNISPLGEIEAIYLGRSLDGTLKGTFDVTFASFDLAQELKSLLNRISRQISDGSIVFDKKENDKKENDKKENDKLISPETIQKIKNAAQWLLSIRKPGPKEMFLTKSTFKDLLTKHSWVNGCVDQNNHGMKRRFPRQMEQQPVDVLSFADVAQKRKLQEIISGVPLITLLGPLQNDSHIPPDLPDRKFREGMLVHVKTSMGKMMTLECSSSDTVTLVKSLIMDKLWQEEHIFPDPDNNHLFFGELNLKDSCVLSDYGIRNKSTLYFAVFVVIRPLQSLSLIARIDVTEEEFLAKIQKCYVRPDFMKLKELPAFYTPESTKLSTCNSGKTLKWLDIRKNREPEIKDWNLWTIQFRSEAQFDLRPLQELSGSAEEEQNKFCQPYPQSVFDFALISHQGGSEKQFFIRWDPAQFPHATERNSGNGFVLRICFEKTHIFDNKKDSSCKALLGGGNYLDLQFVNSTFVRLKPRSQSRKESECFIKTDDHKESECIIKMDDHSVASLIFSDMIDDDRINYLFAHWISLASQRIGSDVNQESSTKFTPVKVKQLDFWGRDASLLLNIPQSFVHDIGAHLNKAFEFNAHNFISGLRSLAHPFMLEQHSATGQNDTFKLSNCLPCYSQIFCRFCGLRSTINNSVFESLGHSISACCIGHFQSEPQTPKFKLNVMQKSDTPVFEGVMRDKNIGSALAKIKKLENELCLNLNVKSLTVHKTIREVHCFFRLHLRLYRDEFDGPAFIAFCIDSSDVAAAKIDAVDIEIRSANFAVKGNISKTEPISSIAITGTTDALVEELLYVEKLSRVYGKLAQKQCQGSERKNGDPADVIGNNPEGGTVPADSLRYFFEPEYFDTNFELVQGTHVTRVIPGYPTMDIRMTPFGDSLVIPVYSWNFEEFQSKKLEDMIVTRRKLEEATFLATRRKLVIEQEKKNTEANRPLEDQMQLDDGDFRWTLRLEPEEQSIRFATLFFAKGVELGEDHRQFRIPVNFSAVSAIIREESFQKQNLDNLIALAQKYQQADEHRQKTKKPAKKDRQEDESLNAYLGGVKKFIALSSDISGKKKDSLKKSTSSIDNLLLNHSNSLCSNFPDIYFAPFVSLLDKALDSQPVINDAELHSGFCLMMSQMFDPEKKAKGSKKTQDPEKKRSLYKALEEFQRNVFQFFKYNYTSGSSAADVEACTGAVFRHSDIWYDFSRKKFDKATKEDLKHDLPVFASKLIRCIIGGDKSQEVSLTVENQSTQSDDDLHDVLREQLQLFNVSCVFLPQEVCSSRPRLQENPPTKVDIEKCEREIKHLQQRWNDLVTECLDDFCLNPEAVPDIHRETETQTLETFKFFLQEKEVLVEDHLIRKVRSLVLPASHALLVLT